MAEPSSRSSKKLAIDSPSASAMPRSDATDGLATPRSTWTGNSPTRPPRRRPTGATDLVPRGSIGSAYRGPSRRSVPRSPCLLGSTSRRRSWATVTADASRRASRSQPFAFGDRPKRSSEKIASGSVEEPAVDTNVESTTSSNENVNASRNPATIAGDSSGSVTRKNASHRVAPRSAAASSAARSDAGEASATHRASRPRC